MEKKCLVCGKIIHKKSNQSLNTWNNKVKYCSRRCVGLSCKKRIIILNKERTGWKQSEKSLKIMRIKRVGKKPALGMKHTEKTKERIRFKVLEAQTESVRLNKSLSHRGEKNYNWKEGRTKLKHQIRTGYLYRKWRKDVFTKDYFTCKDCDDDKGGNLQAHHLVSLEKILDKHNIKTLEQAEKCDELWKVSNGITLCKKCHKKRHCKNNYKKQNYAKNRFFTSRHLNYRRRFTRFGYRMRKFWCIINCCF